MKKFRTLFERLAGKPDRLMSDGKKGGENVVLSWRWIVGGACITGPSILCLNKLAREMGKMYE